MFAHWPRPRIETFCSQRVARANVGSRGLHMQRVQPRGQWHTGRATADQTIPSKPHKQTCDVLTSARNRVSKRVRVRGFARGYRAGIMVHCRTGQRPLADGERQASCAYVCPDGRRLVDVSVLGPGFERRVGVDAVVPAQAGADVVRWPGLGEQDPKCISIP
jgi:hypothetical protein